MFDADIISWRIHVHRLLGVRAGTERWIGLAKGSERWIGLAEREPSTFAPALPQATSAEGIAEDDQLTSSSILWRRWSERQLVVLGDRLDDFLPM